MRGAFALWRDAQHGRDRRRDGGRVADWRQLDHPHAVRELAGQLGPDFDGQSRLAHPADTAQYDEATRPHELDDLVNQLLATDQRAQLLWEVAREVINAAKHREVGREPVGHELVHRHPAAQTVEPVLAQGSQRDAIA